ncbi:hypothetical protein SAMN03159496_04642 [Rhizobium sp. NFR07]|uniref:hypothetical protein n=1 Tax=Rhizobium sp. NFR07 TaxID=1566262 RepID=UPI0008EC06BE|nr:hypothetical protein [Rhizobium sp. NFR07]SFB52380.1 hypothetical protein SAMN03159496_04642 [Rhizobium sp. NFR07]
MTFPSAATLAVLARDAVGVSAVASIAIGSWMIYPPAGFIVGGLLILAGVLLDARNNGGD